MQNGRNTIILATLIGGLIATGLVFLMHPVFTAKAVVLPPQQGQSSAGLLTQLGNLASLTGLGSSAAKDPNDLYMAVLQSNTVEDGLIKRLNLMAAYKTKKLTEARLALASNSKFVSEKGGMISITVKDEDPHRAAQIANAYVDELHDINSRLIIGEAAVRRNFFAPAIGAGERPADRRGDCAPANGRKDGCDFTHRPDGCSDFTGGFTAGSNHRS